MADTTKALQRDLYILEDESNPYGSRADTIWPSTVLDQVFDNLSPTHKTLRSIIDELRQEIKNGGIGNIRFPVTSVNGMTGDINIDKGHLGLDNVDNTKDIDKPLSNPQRKAINEILDNFNFQVDLSDLYNHIQNSSNPHAVTLEQLNRNGEVRDYISQLISRHNNSTDAHDDIRTSVADLNTAVVTMNNTVDTKLSQTTGLLDAHCYDLGAHSTLFAKKEDAANKAISLDTLNHVLYPTTRAVAEYVASRVTELRTSIEESQTCVDDIFVVDSRDDLPAANVRSYRKAYFIRKGISNNDEIAICRMNSDRKTYSWDITALGTYSKFDMNHFVETENGLSVNTRTIAELIMAEDNVVDLLKESLTPMLPEVLADYYTKDEINSMHYVKSVHLVPGNQDGAIKFYINEDMSTMSENIFIAGIKNLAFLDKVTEGYLGESAVQSRHIANKVIQERHMGDKAVAARSLQASYNTVLGNVEDSGGRTVREIPIESLAEIIYPKFKVLVENLDFYSMPDQYIKDTVARSYAKVIN